MNDNFGPNKFELLEKDGRRLSASSRTFALAAYASAGNRLDSVSLMITPWKRERRAQRAREAERVLRKFWESECNSRSHEKPGGMLFDQT